MGLETDTLSLTTQLVRPILLFWPNSMLDHLDKAQKNELLKTNIFDKMVLLDVNSDYVEFEEGIEQVELFKKDKTLKINVVRLIELKETQSKAAFQFQFEEYMDDVESWVEASKYIRDEAKNQTSNYFEALQPYLELQHEHFKSHLEQLKKRFKISISTRTEEKSSPNVSQINSNELSSILQKSNLNSPLTTSPSPKKKVKQKLSVSEVDEYLLSTVFNVDHKVQNTEKLTE